MDLPESFAAHAAPTWGLQRLRFQYHFGTLGYRSVFKQWVQDFLQAREHLELVAGWHGSWRRARDFSSRYAECSLLRWSVTLFKSLFRTARCSLGLIIGGTATSKRGTLGASGQCRRKRAVLTHSHSRLVMLVSVLSFRSLWLWEDARQLKGIQKLTCKVTWHLGLNGVLSDSTP